MTDEQNKRRGLFGRRKTKLTDGPLFPDDDSPLPDDESLIADTSSILDGGGLAEELPLPPERYPPTDYTETTTKKRARPPAKAQTDIPAGRKRRHGDWRHNLIALLFFIATIGLCGAYSMIWNDPWTPLNPLAPATEFYLVTETPDPLAVFNINATATSRAQAAPENVEPITSFSGLPFSISDSGVIYTPNANGSGCDWASIGGTVVGLNGEPLNGYRIRITDSENPDRLDVEVFSGAVLTFGDGGFEFTLGNAPRAGRYDVQLFSAAGAPLSDAYRIVTRETCQENVAILNFIQIAPI